MSAGIEFSELKFSDDKKTSLQKAKANIEIQNGKAMLIVGISNNHTAVKSITDFTLLKNLPLVMTINKTEKSGQIFNENIIFNDEFNVMVFSCQDIQNRILSNGFYVIRTKKYLIDSKLAHEFYQEHKDKFFFNRLVTFMCSGPCCFHILARENAIKTWRAMMGPTKVFQTVYTHPDTIRGTHGLTDTRNATHGSDSQQSAEREIQFFFPDFSTSDWYSNEHDKFVNGSYEFNAEEFVHKCAKGS